MIPEKPGIYWIKIKNGNYYSGWIVGEYSEYWKWQDCWKQVGNEPDWGDPTVIQIGAEIRKPED